MYRAKDSGPDRFEVYDHEVDRAIERSVNLQHDLRKAIDSNRLLLHYQPIVNMLNGLVVGAEALVRIRPLEGGDPILPDQFVPQAERSGLVLPLGAWVVQHALGDLQAWRKKGSKCGLSINVSPVQFRKGAFATFLLREVDAAELDPAHLTVEVTETAFIQDPHGAVRELATFKRGGVGICLDDFGTGYSSLSWLMDFPVDAVKIDKTFVSVIGSDPRRHAIVSALINVAQELDVRVIAEGIETAEQNALLLELGCVFGQGYYFG
jgi:EAL domain-containing protein (putative c-di-GMP-specific phosphodiesterase class I)